MLILASASPRRQELLRNARILFKVQPADVPEVRGDGEPPEAFAQRLAREKARAIFNLLRPPAGTFVLGADTVVVVDGEVLGKPADEADAARMLQLLSGRQHQVITGVCLLGQPNTANEREAGNGKRGTVVEHVRCETTQVFFAPLSDDDIQDYINTGEPMDKAGAYGIQGMASRWIPRIEGDYFNVVGLPVALVCRMLREQGAL
ncbi:MAG: nucleoside triphosphate pyrophosphatase [Terriglobales bacterium]